MIYKIIKKTALIIASLLLIVLVFLLVMKLLGYSYNKEFLGEFLVVVNKQQCIEAEYPTYYHHSGIEGCVFWAREYNLKTTQDWESLFTRDDAYCDQKYRGQQKTDGIDLRILEESSDLKCSFEALRRQKRNENWDYLVSKEHDEFYDSCVEKFCSWSSLPPLFK